MIVPTLGRLEKVDLRNVWLSEPASFTPWLARDENIALLGETIGIDLEVEAQEKNVGPFKADILCKNTATDQWVLVENQLERTDHTHLGQLLTYAAGLQAVTIIWIANAFTEEHRAALDWLNEITDERFNFFGLEVELWRIGESQAAPKFNIVCKPNDWTKTVQAAAAQVQSTELSPTKQLQIEYWTQLGSLLQDGSRTIRRVKALPQNWLSFSVGRSDFQLHALMNTREKLVAVDLVLIGANAKVHFALLEEQKDVIEAEIGERLAWREMLDRKESRITLLRRQSDPADRSEWPSQHAWLHSQLEAFHRTFARRIRTLNASNYEGGSGAGAP